MTDNKRKKKADGRRVALTQDHEREYLERRINLASYYASLAASYAQDAVERLRAGFPRLKRARRK